MISHQDQLDLFELISKQISKDISCYAFGGTAMMFFGYKDETKDVDLLFLKEGDRQEFIKAIKNIGYKESSPMEIYIPEKLREKHRPLMFVKNDSRFDLFVKKIFKTVISPNMEEDVFAKHDFKSKNNLRLNVLRAEHIVMLKSVTERINDFDDIKKIIEIDKHFQWQYLIDEVIWQYRNGDSWVLLDMEKIIKELKKYVFVEEKYLKQLYGVKKK